VNEGHDETCLPKRGYIHAWCRYQFSALLRSCPLSGETYFRRALPLYKYHGTVLEYIVKETTGSAYIALKGDYLMFQGTSFINTRPPT
jgi:hypothetical protein